MGQSLPDCKIKTSDTRLHLSWGSLPTVIHALWCCAQAPSYNKGHDYHNAAGVIVHQGHWQPWTWSLVSLTHSLGSQWRGGSCSSLKDDIESLQLCAARNINSYCDMDCAAPGKATTNCSVLREPDTWATFQKSQTHGRHFYFKQLSFGIISHLLWSTCWTIVVCFIPKRIVDVVI